MRRCNQCGETKPLSEFGDHKGNPQGKSYMCKPCRRTYDNRRYKNNPQDGRDRSAKHKVIKYELNKTRIWAELQKPCVDCGLVDPVVMEFDHRPNEKKLYNIGAMVGNTYSIATLDRELAKCDIVCANCHRHRTNKRAGWWRSLHITKEEDVQEQDH